MFLNEQEEASDDDDDDETMSPTLSSNTNKHQPSEHSDAWLTHWLISVA